MDISRIADWEMPVIPEFAAGIARLAFLPAPADAPMLDKVMAAADFAPIIQVMPAMMVMPAQAVMFAAEEFAAERQLLLVAPAMVVAQRDARIPRIPIAPPAFLLASPAVAMTAAADLFAMAMLAMTVMPALIMINAAEEFVLVQP